MSKKILAVVISVVLLCGGWLGWSGLPMVVALVPMLWISGEAEDSRKGWWSTFWYALLFCVAWNLSTIWWIGYSTPVGPIGATVASSFLTMVSFMIFHTASKKASKALAYTLLVSVWVACEYLYSIGDFSWPWLLLGNGLSNDIWAVQWYEYTGLFGGSVWLLLCNISIYEAWRSRSVGGAVRSALLVVLPLVTSAVIYFTYEEPTEFGSVEVSVIQPNVDCYDKFNGDSKAQQRNLVELLCEVPASSDLVLMPETSVSGHFWESRIDSYNAVRELRDTLASRLPETTLVAGMTTVVGYKAGEQTTTARKMNGGGYYDLYNSAVAITADAQREVDGQIHHKARLVIGVENTPTIIFKLFSFFVVDLGGIVGQLGRGEGSTVFTMDGGVKYAPAICYEGLYGDFMGGFARGGAQFFAIISNDGWWRDTPGHRHLFTMAALRAVEHRRSVARSANTGTSGFITSRGDAIETLGWDKRGVLTQDISLNSRQTIYTIYGDYVGRVSLYIALLSLLYYVAYRIKRRNYLD